MVFKSLLLNLPSQLKVIRRYMCSAVAYNYLFPPQELLALGGIITDWKKDPVELVDAIAEGLDDNETLARIKLSDADLIVTISGFETFEADMEYIKRIKAMFPEKVIVLFGHYPTTFPEETLKNVPVDYIILGEPDLIFSELYDAIKFNCPVDTVEGIAYLNAKGDVIKRPGVRRIPDPNALPVPAYNLLKAEHYYEFFLPKPFGLIQTARGCPYKCNYCVKSFGTKLTVLSPQNIVEHIKVLQNRFGIKSLRFIDDTFTATPKRVIDLCKLMVEQNIRLSWTCLSRTDTVNEEMVKWMSKAGCKRIYFGIESGSPKILKLLNKEMDLQQSIANLLMCKKHGIETAGFFLLGHPFEDDNDLNLSIDFAIKAKLNYVAVGDITPYPGTSLYEMFKNEIDFSLFPYHNAFKDKSITETYQRRQRRFYLRFYFRPSFFIGNAAYVLKNFKDMLPIFSNVFNTMKKSYFMVFPNFKSADSRAKKAQPQSVVNTR